jgi:hypothetical protein
MVVIAYPSCPRAQHPAAEQEPALAFDQTPHPATLAEELSPPDLVYGLAGVLHDMKLVVYLLRHLEGNPELLPSAGAIRVVEAVNGNIKVLLWRGRGYKNLRCLLLKAQRLADLKTRVPRSPQSGVAVGGSSRTVLRLTTGSLGRSASSIGDDAKGDQIDPSILSSDGTISIRLAVSPQPRPANGVPRRYPPWPVRIRRSHRGWDGRRPATACKICPCKNPRAYRRIGAISTTISGGGRSLSSAQGTG